jgi:hypothetical protein
MRLARIAFIGARLRPLWIQPPWKYRSSVSSDSCPSFNSDLSAASSLSELARSAIGSLVAAVRTGPRHGTLVPLRHGRE